MYAHQIADLATSLAEDALFHTQHPHVRLYEPGDERKVRPTWLIGGHKDTGLPPNIGIDDQVIAVQRAILHPEVRERADMVYLYDSRAYGVLELDKYQLPWIACRPKVYRALVKIGPKNMLFCHRHHTTRGAMGSGPAALAYALDFLNPEYVMLHGFACQEGDAPYDYQRRFFEMVGEGEDVYETEGSLLGIFEDFPHD